MSDGVGVLLRDGVGDGDCLRSFVGGHGELSELGVLAASESIVEAKWIFAGTVVRMDVIFSSS